MVEHLRKPEWLKVQLGGDERFIRTKEIVESHCLHTICSSGLCPNRGECWSHGTATFMIGGEICTRSCRFCNTLSGKPLPLDPTEPTHVAESIQLMKLHHAVITSVDRDDLDDLGAAHWVKTIREIRRLNPETTIATRTANRSRTLHWDIRRGLESIGTWESSLPPYGDDGSTARPGEPPTRRLIHCSLKAIDLRNPWPPVLPCCA